MSELLPCPFCGGEAETLTAESMYGGYLFGIMCNDCRSRGDVYDTEEEAIEAWNTRAAYEMDGCEEIVRCRDCTQRESDYCHWIDRFIKLNGFCAWGERKERIEQ